MHQISHFNGIHKYAPSKNASMMYESYTRNGYTQFELIFQLSMLISNNYTHTTSITKHYRSWKDERFMKQLIPQKCDSLIKYEHNFIQIIS